MIGFVFPEKSSKSFKMFSKHFKRPFILLFFSALSLCQFEIPQDIVFDYARVAKLLVNVLQAHNADNLTQRIVVFLLNSMACHVEGDQKLQVGDIGAIEARKFLS